MRKWFIKRHLYHIGKFCCFWSQTYKNGLLLFKLSVFVCGVAKFEFFYKRTSEPDFFLDREHFHSLQRTETFFWWGKLEEQQEKKRRQLLSHTSSVKATAPKSYIVLQVMIFLRHRTRCSSFFHHLKITIFVCLLKWICWPVKKA